MNRTTTFAALFLLPLCISGTGWSEDTALPAAPHPADHMFKVETTQWQGEKALRLPMNFAVADWKKAWKNAGLDEKFKASPSQEVAWLYVTANVYQLQDVDGKTLISGPRADLELDKAHCIKMRTPKASVCGYLAVAGAATPEWWHEPDPRTDSHELMRDLTKNFTAAYTQIAAAEAVPVPGHPIEVAATPVVAPTAVPIAVTVPPVAVPPVPAPPASPVPVSPASIAENAPPQRPVPVVLKPVPAKDFPVTASTVTAPPAAAAPAPVPPPASAAPVPSHADPAQGLKSMARNATPLELAAGPRVEPAAALAETPRPEIRTPGPRIFIHRLARTGSSASSLAVASPIVVPPAVTAPVAAAPVASARAEAAQVVVAPVVVAPVATGNAGTGNAATVASHSVSAERLKSLARSAAPLELAPGPRVEPGYALAEPPRPELRIVAPRFFIHRVAPGTVVAPSVTPSVVAASSPVPATPAPAQPAQPAKPAQPVPVAATPVVLAAATTVPVAVKPDTASLKAMVRNAAPLPLAAGPRVEPASFLAEAPRAEARMAAPEFLIHRVAPSESPSSVLASAPVVVAPAIVAPAAPERTSAAVAASAAKAVPHPVQGFDVTPATAEAASTAAPKLNPSSPTPAATGTAAPVTVAMAPPVKVQTVGITAATGTAATGTAATGAVAVLPLTGPHSALLEAAERKAMADHLIEVQLARNRTLAWLPSTSVAKSIPVTVSVEGYRPRMATSTVFVEKVRSADGKTSGHPVTLQGDGFDADPNTTASSGGRMLRPAAKSASLPPVITAK